ncbi:hypothetical protein QUA40_28375 [Microcoleus sp. Pol11C3]|uniref:hypothetical protein n=1 Tax=Microcoleus sp. Pol11C3 TaxID=3055390 RepID=UPI002FD52BA4
MELTKYSWWGESNESPEHLKTKKQLAQLGLSPLKPSGIIPTRKYDVFLYDIHNSECCRCKRKPSPNQLETLAAKCLKAHIKRNYQQWYREAAFIKRDWVRAVKGARKQLLGPDEGLILDTETTGLDNAEIVEIAVINPLGEALLNTLVRPRISIPA